MTKLNQSKGGSKVPILGDLPIIGGAFRSVANSNVNKELYVFVKAKIIRPDSTTGGMPDLEEISYHNRIAFEEFEREFQNYADFPGFKTKPMNPIRVLEED